MVACHGKLRVLFLDDEIVQVFLLGEFIAESQTIIEQAEADDDVTVVLGLVECYLQLIVVVADDAFFSPDRTPGLIHRRGTRVVYGESAHQVRFLVEDTLVLVSGYFKIGLLVGILPFQFQSELAWLDDCLVFECKVISGTTFFVEAEVHHQIAVGRCEFLCAGEYASA